MLPNYAANFPENLLTKLRLWVNGWDGEFLSYWIFLLHRRFLFFGAFYSPPSDVIRILHFPLNRFYIGFFFGEWNTICCISTTSELALRIGIEWCLAPFQSLLYVLQRIYVAESNEATYRMMLSRMCKLLTANAKNPAMLPFCVSVSS